MVNSLNLLRFKAGFFADTQADARAESGRVLVWDGWRGFAILLVLLGHFYDISWLWEDRLGVDIFFVLSGMLMSTILFEKRMSLRDFYIRRFSRIYPVFLVCVLAMFAIAASLSFKVTFIEFIASLTFMRTYVPADPHIWAGRVAIQHLWSLNVEEHAYVFLSAISLLFINRRYIAIGLLLTGAGLVVLGFYQYTQLSEAEFLKYIIRTECAIVFILFSAGYGLLTRQYKITVPSVVPVACVVIACFCYATAASMWLLFSACPVLLAVAVNHLTDMPRFVIRVLSNSVIRHFGLWSYSIYIWQQMFFKYSYAVPGEKFTGLLLALVAGAASYYLFEQPMRRAINKRWSPRPTYRSNSSMDVKQAHS